MKKTKGIKEKIIARFKGMTFKSYLRETIEFFNTNLKKPAIILAIISALLIVMSISPLVSSMQAGEYNANEFKDLSFGEAYITGLQVIFIVIFAGIVPYMYVPVIGGLAGAYNELLTFAYVIAEKGYIKATLIYIIPMVLNIVIITVAAALGIYICKTVTAGYKLDNMKHMNVTNFRLELYKITKKDKKRKELEDRKNKRIKELESNSKKIDFFELVNITVILFVLQIIASILRAVII